MTPDHSALIERLEAGPVYLTHKEAYDIAIFFGSDTALGLASLIRKAFAGGSLDAALALAELVLPDWAWEIRLDRGGASVQTAPAWWMEGLAAPDEGGVSCDGKTPALALCIAILKAKAQGEGG